MDPLQHYVPTGNSVHHNHALQQTPSKTLFSISAVTATRWALNRTRMFRSFWLNLGPTCKHSFSEGFPSALADASHTIRSLVVLISVDDCMVGKIVNLGGSLVVCWNVLQNTHLDLLLYGVIFLQDIGYLSQAFQQPLKLVQTELIILW